MTITARYINTCLSDYLLDGCNRPGQALCLASLGGTIEETVEALYESIGCDIGLPESIEDEEIMTALRDELFSGVDLRYIDETGTRRDEAPEDRDSEEPYIYVVLEWDATVISMTMTVEVDYLANGTDPQELKHNLEWMVKNAMSEGVLTCDTDAEVDSWGATATPKGESPEAAACSYVLAQLEEFSPKFLHDKGLDIAVEKLKALIG
jgi:hypothetical protein